MLKQTKVTSVDIAFRLAKNEDTEKSLNAARQKYSAIATRASILYFTVQHLTSLNVMYQFSLSWFYTVFQACLHGPKKEIEPEKKKTSITIGGETLDLSTKSSNNKRMSMLRRTSTQSKGESQPDLREVSFQSYVDSILDFLTHTVYQVVSWALFTEHQLIFSFSVCVNILKHALSEHTEQKISLRENAFFLMSALLADMQQNALAKKVHDLGDFKVFERLTLDEKSVRQLLLLEETLPHKFNALSLNMKNNHDTLWKEFMAVKDPYKYMALNGWHYKFLLKMETTLIHHFSKHYRIYKMLLVQSPPYI